MELVWDQTGERTYETGVDRGVLYSPDNTGAYNNGYAWNGLTAVNESPSGAEATALYADNIKYLNLTSAEEFGATIEAYTYPDEFAIHDGSIKPVAGVTVGQQTRRPFGFAYRTLVGNDIEGTDYGYKIHLVYGATATPSEKSYATVNDSPEAITFSWEIETVSVPVPNAKPAATIVIDSTDPDLDPTKLADLEAILYGTSMEDPRLPLPAEVLSVLGGAALVVANPVAPTFAANTITIPTVTGLEYRIDGEVVTGTRLLEEDESVLVEAKTLPGYKFPDTAYDKDWLFTGS